MLQFLQRLTCQHVWTWSERRQVERCYRCRATRQASPTETLPPMTFPDPAPSPSPSPPEVLTVLLRDDDAFAGFRAGGLHTPLVLERSVDGAAAAAAAGTHGAGLSNPR